MVEGECIEWEWGKDKDGYGKVGIDHKHLRAHRVAWEMFYGPIPNGL
jgi:hypothetical protein